MTLKKKLLFVVAGMIFSPMILMMTLFYLQSQLGWERTSFDSRIVSLFYLRNWENFGQDHTPILPERSLIGSQILVDENNTILASNTPGLEVGQSWLPRQESPLPGDIFAFPLKDGNILIQIFTDSFFLGDRQGLLHMFQMPLLLAVLFVIFMVIMILRSINRSVVRLSLAMERVASGDLDYQYTHLGKDELGKLGQAYESMRRALKEEKGRQSRFLLGVSHDLKTPLASIRGYLEAMHDGFDDTPKKRAEFLAIMDQKAQILQSRITSLIELMKMTTQEWKSRLVHVDLQDQLETLAQGFSQEGSMTGHTLEWSREGVPQFFTALDPDLLERALENLIHNAFQHGDPNQKIQFSWNLTHSEARITVANNGKSIREENLQRIFEPFFKENPGRNTLGSGLGLASVKHICDAHGWELVVASREESTQFTIIVKA